MRPRESYDLKANATYLGVECGKFLSRVLCPTYATISRSISHCAIRRLSGQGSEAKSRPWHDAPQLKCFTYDGLVVPTFYQNERKSKYENGRLCAHKHSRVRCPLESACRSLSIVLPYPHRSRALYLNCRVFTFTIRLKVVGTKENVTSLCAMALQYLA